MAAHPRIRRVAKWTGAGVATLVLLAWAAIVPLFHSNLLYIDFGVGSFRGSLNYGALSWDWFHRQLPPLAVGVAARWAPRVGNLADCFGIDPPQFKRDAISTYVYLPLWVPFLLVAAPTALLLYRDRRRTSPGHCPKCGYNLKGNVSGRCSECGTPIDQRAGDPAAPSQPRG